MRNLICSVAVLLLCSSASATEGDEFLKEIESVARGIVNGYLDNDALIREHAPFRHIGCPNQYCAPADSWPYGIKVQDIGFELNPPRSERNPENNIRLRLNVHFEGRLPVEARLTGEGIFGQWSRVVPPLRAHGDWPCVYVKYESTARKVYAIASIFAPVCVEGEVPEVSSVHLGIYKNLEAQQ